MKKTFIQLLSTICAVYFLIAGSGYNLVKYCCNTCEKEGIEVVAQKSCVGVHHEHHDGSRCCEHHHDSPFVAEDMKCDNIMHETGGCQLYRIQTDIPCSVDLVKFISEDNGTWIDFHFLVTDLFFTGDIQVDNPAFIPPNDTPPRSGRDVLTYHAVLLI